MKTILAWSGALFVVLLVIGAGYIYSGSFDVAAKSPDNPMVVWLANTTRRQSIRHHLAAVRAPDDVDNPDRVRDGLANYHDDCETCHGFPDHWPGPTGEGLNPRPPKLWRDGGQPPSPGYVYWVVMNGIKMTGMPAWAHEYNEKQAWSVVALVRALSHLSGGDYQNRVKALQAMQKDRPPTAR